MVIIYKKVRCKNCKTEWLLPKVMGMSIESFECCHKKSMPKSKMARFLQALKAKNKK